MISLMQVHSILGSRLPKVQLQRAGQDEPPMARPRMLEGIGLGIECVPY